MDYDATPAQRVIEHAIGRGFVTSAQVESALLGGQTHDGLLPLLRPHLSPPQLAELQQVYQGTYRGPLPPDHELDGERTVELVAPKLGADSEHLAEAQAAAPEGTLLLSAEEASGVHRVANLGAQAPGSPTLSPQHLGGAPALGTHSPHVLGGQGSGSPTLSSEDLAGNVPDLTQAPDYAEDERPSRALPEIGDTVGGFEIQREIARGAMGVVFAGRRPDGAEAAIKVMISAGDASPALLTRFDREAKALGKLKHEHIVCVHEAGQHQGNPFIAMEFVEGESLQQRIARDGKLDPREAARMTENMARAMEHAHGRGLLHRDLKPDNVLLDSEGRVRITDFGLAKSLESDHERLTKTGELLGTPSYMPPEQANGSTDLIGPRSDVYSLGATLYAALCGKPPFKGQTTVNTITQVITQPPPSLRKQVEGLDADLETICFKCLEKKPRDRYRACAELADDLGRYLLGQPIQARPVTAVGKLRRKLASNRALAVSAALLFLALVGLLGLGIKAQVLPEAEESLARVSIAVEPLPPRLHGQALELAFAVEPLVAKARVRLNDGPWATLPVSRRYLRSLTLSLGANTLEIEARGVDGAISTITTRVECLTPTWWNELEGEPRPEYPLPDGLAFSETPLEYRHAKSGVALVYVPAGEFVLGINPKENLRIGGEDQLPSHLVRITRPFFLGKYELTREEFARYLQAKSLAKGAYVSADPEPEERRLPARMNWDEAQDFCAWAGLRLPSEVEWEYAAEGGMEGRAFPWGDELLSEPSANLLLEELEDDFPDLSPVGSFPLGVSRWGSHDMSGNMSEWTEDVYQPYPPNPSEVLVDYVARGDGKHVLRGSGCYERSLTSASCNYRKAAHPGLRGKGNDVGGLRPVFTPR